MPIEWVLEADHEPHRDEAQQRIAARDPDDWPTVALALALGLPVWSQDKDLADVGVEVFTTGEPLTRSATEATKKRIESGQPPRYCCGRFPGACRGQAPLLLSPISERLETSCQTLAPDDLRASTLTYRSLPLSSSVASARWPLGVSPGT